MYIIKNFKQEIEHVINNLTIKLELKILMLNNQFTAINLQKKKIYTYIYIYIIIIIIIITIIIMK